MSIALTTQQPSVSMQDWQVLQSQASTLLKSGFLPKSITTPEQAIAIMLQGRELGIPAMAALGTINVIQGKPTVSPQLMLALIYRSKQLDGLTIDSTDQLCQVEMIRHGIGVFESSFSMDDARRLGLADKDNWKKQPKIMLKWRAVAACAREGFADVVLGLYTPEEMGANVEVSDEGEMQVLPDSTPSKSTVEEQPARAPRMIDRFKEPEEPPAHIEPATGQIIEAEVVTVPADSVRMPSQEDRDGYGYALKKAHALGIETGQYALETDTTWAELQSLLRQLSAAIRKQEAAQTTLPV